MVSCRILNKCLKLNTRCCCHQHWSQSLLYFILFFSVSFVFRLWLYFSFRKATSIVYWFSCPLLYIDTKSMFWLWAMSYSWIQCEQNRADLFLSAFANKFYFIFLLVLHQKVIIVYYLDLKLRFKFSKNNCLLFYFCVDIMKCVIASRRNERRFKKWSEKLNKQKKSKDQRRLWMNLSFVLFYYCFFI